ncbi:hypothetical protein Tco_0772365 [Tanacetum coccineum]|uniref:Uncharacterized protein n=1 Tax=Tanacetum coccineum TaxID=301880 RepID=A0ABQ4ZHP9_9ASTR
MNERALQKWEYDASNGTESQKQDTSSRSRNDADIRPIYDEEPMAEVQMTADDNVSATGQQHTEQPESNNEGEVDQNADQCYDTRPLPAKLTDNTTTELSNQLLESENVCLKKTVAQFQKDFAKLETHCINLELQMENNVLKSGQHSQFLNEKSNEAKVKNDIDVTETINIELEHSRILKTVYLRWVPTGKIFTSSTIKVDSETPNGSKEDINNQCESEQACDVSARPPFHHVQMKSDHNSSGPRTKTTREIVLLKMSLQASVLKEQRRHIMTTLDPVSPRQNVVRYSKKTDSSQQGFEFLFQVLLLKK